jgi:phosphate transport system protein
MTEAKHILTSFDEALSSLRNQVLIMAALSIRSLENALRGLRERNDDLCLQTIADDEEIDQLEKQIDREGVDLLIRYQPVASDLRRVVSAMKLSPNLERIADEAVSIARRSRKLNRHRELGEVQLIMKMGTHALQMVKDSIEAFARGDIDRGRELVARDDPLDEMNADAAQQLVARAAEDREELRGYLNLVFIARHLERVGDHATNIGEETVYAAAAEDIRHQRPLDPNQTAP